MIRGATTFGRESRNGEVTVVEYEGEYLSIGES